MFEKINVTRIISDHYKTISWQDDKALIITPIVVAVTFPFVKSVNKDISNVLMTIFSVFSALLFNVQVLICDIRIRLKSRKETVNAESKEFQDLFNSEKLIGELYAHLSYCIILTLLGIVLLLLGYIFYIPQLNSICLKRIFSIAIYYVVANFLFTLVMVIKRAYNLVKVDMNVK